MQREADPNKVEAFDFEVMPRDAFCAPIAVETDIAVMRARSDWFLERRLAEKQRPVVGAWELEFMI